MQGAKKGIIEKMKRAKYTLRPQTITPFTMYTLH